MSESFKCFKCGVIKPVSDFHIARSKKSSKRGHTRDCKKCYSEYRISTYNKSSKRNYHLQTKYGLTIEQYNEFLISQNGKCAICQSTDPGHEFGRIGENFKVDHDHETGKVRGLLCNNCNMALGLLKDNPDYIRNALSYILKHQTIENVISMVK